MRKAWIFAIQILFLHLASGQRLTDHFRLLNATNGLPSNIVTSAFKDHHGFLWLGTNSGLCRFDGRNTVIYSHQPNDTTSLVNNAVNSVCEDDLGRIWVATEGGVSVLNVQEGKFRNLLFARQKDSVISINTNITSVACFNHRVYVGLQTGILSTLTKSLNLTQCRDSNLHFSRKIRCLPNRAYVTKKGLWIATFAGLFYTEDGVNFMNREYNPRKWAIFDRGTVLAFATDGDSVAWFGTWRYQGFYKYNFSAAHIDSVAVDGLPNVLCMAKVAPHTIWCGTFSRGVLAIDLHTGEKLFQQEDKTTPESHADIKTDQVLADEEGTIFSCSSAGLFYVNPVQAQFSILSKHADERHAFPPSMAFDIQEGSQGVIWCASFVDGLFSFDPTNGETRYYKFKENYNRVWTIHNRGNSLLLGSYAGIASFDVRTKKLTPIDLPKSLEEQTQNGIIFLERISGDEYWIGLWQHGLLRFNLKTGAFTYFSDADPLHPLPGSSPASAVQIREHLWVGFLDGARISKIDNRTNTIVSYDLDSESKSYGGITTLISDPRGNIWAGTTQGGVVCLDAEGKKIGSYTSSDGLTNNKIAFLVFDDAGVLWIGTSNGLNKLDPTNKKITTFTYSDGLPSTQFVDNIIVKHSNGRLYMVTSNKLVSFDPATLKANERLPKLRLTALEKSGTPFHLTGKNDRIELSHDDKVVSAEFTGINFIDPDKTSFAYKLEGFDNKWIYCGKRNYASFTSLPPGNYTLRIKATNKTDNWNVPEYSLNMTVTGPFWKSLWFFTLCLAATFLVSFSIYRLRLNQILKIQEIRDKISRDLHDDIGSSLSSIASYSEVAKRHAAEKAPEITSLLNSLQETANQAMENMSDLVWSINPRNDKFSETLKRLEIFANEILNARGIQSRFDVSKTAGDHKTSMQQRKNIYLICKEAINNVARYSEAKNCVVELNDHNDQITITIRDDGRGIEDLRPSLGGNGILNMKKRALELNGQLDINSMKNSGTLLSLRFTL